MLIHLPQATTPRQLDTKCYTIYDPTLRDDTKLQKNTIFGFEPEYRWTEAYPIEPHRPTNYTRCKGSQEHHVLQANLVEYKTGKENTHE